MFIGHLGAGLALKHFDKKTNLAWFFVSVLFPDLLLWIFVLLGVEEVIVPVNFDKLHYLKFFFPYSHSLLGTIVWSILVYVAADVITKRRKTAILMGAGVLSHFLFDIFVHTPDLSVFGNNSVLLGLGLWNSIYIALLVELVFYFTGLYIYLKGTKGLAFGGKFGMYIFSGLLIAAAFISQVLSPEPLDGKEVAGSALLSVILVILISYWLDKKRVPLEPTPASNSTNIQ